LLRLHGKVEAERLLERPFDLSHVQVWASAMGPAGVTMTSSGREIGSLSWIAEHEVKRKTAKYDHRTGEFEVMFPGTPGIKLVAQAPGWSTREVVAWPPTDPLVSDVLVNLRMVPVPTLRLTVSDEEGNALPGATVRVIILAPPLPMDENPSRLHPAAPWAHVLSRRRDGTTLLRYAKNARLQGGAHELDVPFEGRVFVSVTLEDFVPTFMELGELSGDTSRSVSLLKPTDPKKRVKIMFEGVPVAKKLLMIGNVTNEDVQFPICRIETSPDGMVSAAWFQPDNHYWLSFEAENAFVKYQGQVELDFSRLPRRLDQLR
jgi:hypothetical protein